jgi:multiple sugar transport system substrate-binding protein
MRKIKIKSTVRVFALFLVCASLVFSTTACTPKGGDPAAVAAYKPVKLVYWRVWDDKDAFADVIKAYQQTHPNVKIEYKKFRYDEYEQALVQAIAEDRGPDIFSIHNTWIKKYTPLILSLPATTTIPVKTISGTIQKEEVISMATKKSITPFDVKKNFLDVVADDVIQSKNVGTEKEPKYQDVIWGLPLSVDSLVMYYNKDLLNNAGIAEPAKSWEEFQAQVKKITKIDSVSGNFLVSGAAIGAADNIERSFDLLSLLMMQNLAPMLDDTGSVAFDKQPKIAGVTGVPGFGALDFYAQFASPLYEGYCWNKNMPASLIAFQQGRIAYFFGYSYHRPLIDTAAPKLNYSIAGVPQVGEQQKVNYANYWVETVSSKTKNKDFAWDFIQFATREENVSKFLDKNKKPTALRSAKIINQQLADEKIAIFADQLLTARSWYKGYDPTGAEKAFAEMINAVNSGTLDTPKAVKQAVEKINSTIKKKPQ